ncbi:hypothetical protein N7474_001085 [Penicillium riverlandense]|uniref:uncharacterized protein n=1 Tax=Penicillium riverlandense TaxID=1903569 RepID=UPI002548AAD1|nr:uncharacterized protein N7474_001085 [Penicillium riverlandense]KAJ5832774.1 hypothetical protein N7474_001085 [Penicillium riverlandense]
MAAPPMDALGAFTYLTNNLPAWVARVAELADHTSAKHAEFAETYRRHTTGKTRRRKNSSICSIHTDDNMIPIAERASPLPEAIEASTNLTTESPESEQQRPQIGHKRRTDEAPSLDSAERYTFVSTRHNLIIEYDGHTQKSLEEIVQDIGKARNNLRRAKISTMPRTGIRSNLLGKASVINSSAVMSGKTETTGLSHVRSMRSQPGVVGVRGTSSARQDSPFDYADKQLELAHGLCETAAYQILRSGDCAMELDSVEEKFKMVLDTARNEVERLSEEKKQLSPEEKEEREKEAAQPPPTPSAARMARIAALTAASKSSTQETGPGAIEVDDNSSISAESIDISAFRSSRIRA